MQSIKIYDYIVMEHLGKTKKFDSPKSLYDFWGWDTENNPQEKECALAITRELICFGDFKCEDNNGREIYIKMIKED